MMMWDETFYTPIIRANFLEILYQMKWQKNLTLGIHALVMVYHKSTISKVMESQYSNHNPMASSYTTLDLQYAEKFKALDRETIPWNLEVAQGQILHLGILVGATIVTGHSATVEYLHKYRNRQSTDKVPPPSWPCML